MSAVWWTRHYYQHDVPLVSRQIHTFTHYVLGRLDVSVAMDIFYVQAIDVMWCLFLIMYYYAFVLILPVFTHLFFCLAVELERRIDFELREGLVESRYWSAVTSHTSYWCSHDIALFLLTFIYKQKATPSNPADTPDPEWDSMLFKTEHNTERVKASLVTHKVTLFITFSCLQT